MSSNSKSQLILDLDTTLRDVIQQPTIDNIRLCFSLIERCHNRRLEDEKIIKDDSLYIPAILLLRQFNRFQNPSTFDELLQQFISLFQLIPISTKKTLDDLLGVISIILTKRLMTTNDEVQQDLFIRFFRAFCLSIKTNKKFFYKEFLGNFNQNLPIIGHYISCLLQFYEKINTLDYRLNIIDTLWSFIYVNENENEYKVIIGQILACFLPGILKTFIQDISSIHQRLVQANLILLSYIIRISVNLSAKYENNLMKDELRDMVVERNEQWLLIVDNHIAPILKRLTTDYANHESFQVRRALAIFMLTILGFCSVWLKTSANIAMKTMLVLVSSAKDDQNDIIMKILLEKLFKLPIESTPISPPKKSSSELSYLTYEDEFINEILHSSTITLSDHLLIECQSDLFQLLDQQQISSSSTFTDRRWRLQLFIGYYTFIHHHIDFLFDIDTFTDKLFRFILNTLDFDTLQRNNLNLLNETSLINNETKIVNLNEYYSVYKYLKADVHNEIQRLINLFTLSHSTFPDYLFEQIDHKKIINENNQKILYLLSIIFEKTNFEKTEEYQLLLSLLTQLICDDDNRKQTRKRKKNQLKKEEPISNRNFTIYFLLQCIRTITLPDQTEYHIDYIPLLLLCHSSKYTIIHQTSLLCLTSLSTNLPRFLVLQSEYIIDTSLRKLQTSSSDGYFLLIEFIRLGKNSVINLPIMIHVIEQLLLELSCLPSIESIELTFEFLNVFCQQVIDIVDKKKMKSTLISSQSKSLVDFALDLQKQYSPNQEINNDENEQEKKEEEHLWHKMLVSIVDVFQHFISHSNSHIRSYVLDAFPSLAELLSTIDENLFLPLVHKIWPGLIHRLHDVDFNIRMRCLTAIQCLCKICSDFVDRRIRQDILPILIQQLENTRLISSSNTLEYRYMKYLLTNIGTICNSITMNFDDMEKIILILFQYLQNEQLAVNAYEQLILLREKYSDIIWLKLILHDENEYRKGYFNQMKVYKPELMLTIDSKWKINLISC